MSKEIKGFLKNLKSNNDILKRLNLSPGTVQDYLDSLAVSNDRVWVTADMKPSSLANVLKYRIVFSGNTSGFIREPRRLVKSGNKIICISNNSEIAVFNENMVPESKIGYISNSATDLSGYYTSYDAHVDEPNDLIYIVSRNSHVVTVLKMSDSSLVRTFGTKGSPGNINDGLLNQPIGVTVDPATSDVIITCAYGSDGSTDAGNYGHVSVFAADGTYKSTPLKSYTGSRNAKPWLGALSVPSFSKILEDGLLYVTYPNQDIIGVFDPANNFTCVRQYRRPDGFTVSRLKPISVSLDVTAGEVVVTCNSANVVVGLDKTSGSYKWHVGRPVWDNLTVDSLNNPGDFFGVTDAIVTSNGDIYATDYGNNRIHCLPKKGDVTVETDFVLPAGYEIADSELKERLDPVTGDYTAPIGDVRSGKSLTVPLIRKI